jgi:hypothetical protein
MVPAGHENSPEISDVPFSDPEEVRRRFERWRETREAHARIPDSLWASATLMAGRYGLSKAANTLGVNYQRLKNRLAATSHFRSAPAASGARKRHSERMPSARGSGTMPRMVAEGRTRFVELPVFASAGPCECVLEWEDGSGAKMRIRLQGVTMPDLAALGRSFWNRQP